MMKLNAIIYYTLILEYIIICQLPPLMSQSGVSGMVLRCCVIYGPAESEIIWNQQNCDSVIFLFFFISSSVILLLVAMLHFLPPEHQVI